MMMERRRPEVATLHTWLMNNFPPHNLTGYQPDQTTYCLHFTFYIYINLTSTFHLHLHRRGELKKLKLSHYKSFVQPQPQSHVHAVTSSRCIHLSTSLHTLVHHSLGSVDHHSDLITSIAVIPFLSIAPLPADLALPRLDLRHLAHNFRLAIFAPDSSTLQAWKS